ncbi:phospholipase A [Microbulbifer thermotolerans]|uniref:Phospholipase A1 n=1 Tax=Microbulbifer thermotolerans TaxID=252514 RepID=A0AB35HVI1_MICTH|nr:phospholipase A [Microbulbifer thermotolerans]MCX2780516.1 phospholipase A [Microbulbifer thermotolerans]MCX2783187.1 phospholipase A [Microbulbifer thermotolerans]MCX2794211.1 phospholipase A [Microbulbifer thermotolerans]MCX2800767.1 phospholipase A [Microbulbifer thermotolerans]MCX2803554.1 phospholipase A [Microbulbifer thermotolerans]
MLCRKLVHGFFLSLFCNLPAVADVQEADLTPKTVDAQLTMEQRELTCLREQLLMAQSDVTVAEMRRFCTEQVHGDPVLREERSHFATESAPEPVSGDEVITSDAAMAIRDAASNPFTLASHKTNYLLPLVYNPSPDEAGLEDIEPLIGDTEELDSLEVQFQLSVQVPVWRGFLGQASFMSVAYTNRSFWQAYNSDNSSPFRETNHEPELIMTWLNDRSLFGWQNVANQLAINHQSNGRSEPLSRSWNRIYANFVFARDCYLISFKPWYRIPEKREDDDNPDIEHYLGHFELSGRYQRGEHSISLMLRNNLRSDNHGAVELSWGFPIGNRVRGYMKYFNGYGESLIDYDESVQTLGFGFELAQGF